MTLNMIEREKFNEGKLEMLFELVKDGIIEPSEAASRSSMTQEEFDKEMKKAGY